MFDSIQKIAARQQLSLLGGVLVNLQTKAGALPNVLALVERNVELMAENGLGIEKHIIASFLIEEVPNLAKQDSFPVGAETFTVTGVMSKDEFILKVFVRG